MAFSENVAKNTCAHKSQGSRTPLGVRAPTTSTPLTTPRQTPEEQALRPAGRGAPGSVGGGWADGGWREEAPTTPGVSRGLGTRPAEFKRQLRHSLVGCLRTSSRASLSLSFPMRKVRMIMIPASTGCAENEMGLKQTTLRVTPGTPSPRR